jgi:hypothetical protein
VQCFEHEGIHDQARFHVGDSRAEGLIAIDPERALCDGPVRKHRVAMTHQNDRPAAPASGMPRCQTVAVSGVGSGLADDAGGFEMSAQAIPDRVDPMLVVAAGIDVHEIRQQRDHRMMLPAEILENIGLCFGGHGSLREIDDHTLPPDGGLGRILSIGCDSRQSLHELRHGSAISFRHGRSGGPLSFFPDRRCRQANFPTRGG